MQKLKKSIWSLTLIIIISPFLVYAIVHSYQIKFNRLPVFGQGDSESNGSIRPHHIDKFEFTDQDGNIFSSNKLNNKIVVACFFFTSCPSVCPKMIMHIKGLQENFENDNRIAFVSFTVDPVRDNPERLKWYVNRNKISTKNWTFLTGDKKNIYVLARKSFFLSTIEGDGGIDDFIHSDQLVLVDAQRQIRGYYNGTDDDAIKQLEKDIKKLEDE